MSTLQLQARIFFTRKMLSFVIGLGLVAHFAVDGVVKAQTENIRFPAGWDRVRFLLERRAARAVWLWTLLPASIGWMVAGHAARQVERLAYAR
jgi:hypothetical protein